MPMRSATADFAPAGAATGAAHARSPREIGVEGLTYEIAGKRLIDDLTLSLPADTITVVMGPNGAGKSILLRLMHGLLTPSAGAVTAGGARSGNAVRARQAMVFQKPVLLRRSVAANVDYVLGLRGQRDRARRDALLERVGLQDLHRQPARLLSGGEQQRLALARALATGPETLFLDEPTASLDPASVLTIERIVHDAHANGMKIVFVTHDVGQARRLAGDVVFLHRGRLGEHSAAHHFFEDPACAAAKAFLAGQIVL
jgi:tungstate transport system ATP-binding protein